MQDNNFLGFTSFGNILWWWVLMGGGVYTWNQKNSDFFRIKNSNFLCLIIWMQVPFNQLQHILRYKLQTIILNLKQLNYFPPFTPYWTVSEYLKELQCHFKLFFIYRVVWLIYTIIRPTVREKSWNVLNYVTDLICFCCIKSASHF